MNNNHSIPRPLVRANQASIVVSVLLFLITNINLWLLIPLLSGLSSLLFGFHPIMAVAKKFLRKPLGSYPPEDKAQQRFNQILAVSMLSGAYLFDLLSLTAIRSIFAVMVLMASSAALAGYCIGCFIHYQFHMWRYRRRIARQSA